MSESQLRYWREDPLLNEHHEHWHLVYPYAGLVDPDLHTIQELQDIESEKIEARFLKWKDRHGELFAYMHSQLLARYAAERLSVGLLPVTALNDYRSPILEGYDPGVILKSDGTMFQPAPRPPHASLNDLQIPDFKDRPGAKISSQELFRDRLQAAAADQASENRPANLTTLSELVEPTERFATSYFGAFHNDGHLLIAFHDNDPKNKGVMFWEETAIRDPVFYRWHTHIDKIFQKYKNTLPPNEFSDLPPVEAKNLTIDSESGSRNKLTTEIRQRSLQRPDSSSVSIDYLSHEDFSYRFEAVNDNDTDVQVTVRIFMAPEKKLDDRSAWIEMDKFRYSIPKRATTTISRSSRDSSVIRHPVLTASILEGQDPWPSELGVSPGCRCGWPYTLLLPRGKPDGMAFRFVVFLSPGEDIVTDSLDTANSASYCGVQDSVYPDRRAMGYPFDRPFKPIITSWVRGPMKPPQLTSSVVDIVQT